MVPRFFFQCIYAYINLNLTFSFSAFVQKFRKKGNVLDTGILIIFGKRKTKFDQMISINFNIITNDANKNVCGPKWNETKRMEPKVNRPYIRC